jgi:hypothetical protein
MHDVIYAAMLRRAIILGQLAVLTLLAASASAGNEYLSRTYIDTTIQQVFYTLNAATDVAGMGMKMEDAIAFAKQTASRLKNMAKGNPNERYVLWKVGELESQIYLEESGMLLEKNRKRQKMVNDLVGPFNAEIGNRRPDFSRLAELYNKALAVDRAKAFDFGIAIEDRKKNLRREVVLSLQKAVMEGNFDLAWQELVYLKNNREALGIPLSQYSVLAAKLQAKVRVSSEREFIAVSANTVEGLIARCVFGEARTSLAVLDDRVEGMRDLVMKAEWDRWFFRNKRLREALDRKEDSLIRVDAAILWDQGIVAANDYLENIVKRLGVQPEKVGSMELVILEKAMANRKLQDTAVARQLASIAPQPIDDSSSMFTDLVSAAKKKAQDDADSVRAAQEKRAHLTQAEEVRLANMRVSLEQRKKREEELKKENVAKAEKEMIDIYVLLEKNEIQKAYEEFTDHQALLARYIPTPAFTTLDSTIAAGRAAAEKPKR